MDHFKGRRPCSLITKQIPHAAIANLAKSDHAVVGDNPAVSTANGRAGRMLSERDLFKQTLRLRAKGAMEFWCVKIGQPHLDPFVRV